MQPARILIELARSASGAPIWYASHARGVVQSTTRYAEARRFATRTAAKATAARLRMQCECWNAIVVQIHQPAGVTL
jgi:hypothetical protein